MEKTRIRDKHPGSATLKNTSTVKKIHSKNHLKISIVVNHVGLQLLQHVLYQKATRFHRIIIHQTKKERDKVRYKDSKQIKTLLLVQEQNQIRKIKGNSICEKKQKREISFVSQKHDVKTKKLGFLVVNNQLLG